MLYLINRSDVDVFSPASEIDPEYAKLLKKADETGVEILPYQTRLSQKEITIHKKIDFEI